MEKIVVFVVVIATLNQSLSAQEDRGANKMFYYEMGGPGVLMSLNFDARFTSKERLKLGYRAGAGFGFAKLKSTWVDKDHGLTYIENIRQTYYSVPVGLNYVFGKPDNVNTFEVGAGVTFLAHKASPYALVDEKRFHTIGFLSFMYRVMPVNGGFSFRTGFTPLIGAEGDMLLSGAIGFGYVF